MFVLVRGDPGIPRSEVFGLDILAPRHPKLFALIVERLGFSPDGDNAGGFKEWNTRFFLRFFTAIADYQFAKEIVKSSFVTTVKMTVFKSA
jgi:hypothetical protein